MKKRSHSSGSIDLSSLDRFRVAHLATANAHGKPLVVPICFACGKSRIYSVMDEKPKRVAPSRLRRVRNIGENPLVCLLAHHYSEDWSKLWYAIGDGAAELLTQGPEHSRAIGLLRKKYPQYRTMRIASKPVIKIVPQRLIAWKAV